MNTVGNWMTTITVRDEKRREEWLAMVGTDTLPISSIAPMLAIVNGEYAHVLPLDIHASSEDQQAGIIAGLAQKCDITVEEDTKAFFSQGVPIVTSDTSVQTSDHAALLWFLGDEEDEEDVDEFSDHEWGELYGDEGDFVDMEPGIDPYDMEFEEDEDDEGYTY